MLVTIVTEGHFIICSSLLQTSYACINPSHFYWLDKKLNFRLIYFD